MAPKLKITTKTTVKVTQRTTLVKYVVAGSIILTLFGAAFFVYLNLGNSENAEAGANAKKTTAEADKAFRNTLAEAVFVDLSHLTADEMYLLSNRDFVNDTIRKEYSSVRWNVNSSMSHLTLEVHNVRYEFSLELFDLRGSRLLYFSNLREDKVYVDKLELVPNKDLNYLVRNSIGELYAGNLSF